MNVLVFETKNDISCAAVDHEMNFTLLQVHISFSAPNHILTIPGNKI